MSTAGGAGRARRVRAPEIEAERGGGERSGGAGKAAVVEGRENDFCQSVPMGDMVIQKVFQFNKPCPRLPGVLTATF
ncbi:hypothetical protein WOA01_00175 [Methylocystis sp. IM2]|uniref:hypothetical protein n=1 Tax=Methylocystis sp. IM2 TaxID=3136563 RepID=UPI0030FA0503